jgi:acetylornithine deacetylase/succinyl-diaminopimelate desuccinylase-like protein
MDLRVDQQEALVFLSECVNVKTANPPGDEARMTDVLVRRLGAAGLAVRTHPLSPGRANLLARLPGTGERPALILSGHTDTMAAAP